MVGDGLPRGGAFLGAHRIRSASFRTVGGGFRYRISLLYRRSLFFTPNVSEDASRTGGSLFEHGTHIRYQRRPSPVPNANPTTQPPNHLATTALPALRHRMPQSQKWERHYRQRIYQTAREGGHCKSAARNASQVIPYGKPSLTLSPTHKPQMSSLPQKCSGHHP